MITERLLNEKFRFREDYIPGWLTQSQLDARKLFLNEIHRKNKFISVSECPYCGNRNFIKISEVNKRGLPSDIVICDSCDGCFKSIVFDKETARYYYERISHTLVGKSTFEDGLMQRMRDRIRLFGYPKYKFISHFVELNPEEDLIAEFGCNDGANLMPWKENGFSVIGVDLDSNMVEFGRKWELNLIKSDMLDYDFNDRRPKLIILSHSLDRVTDVNAVLNRIRQILNPDGYVFIETPSIRTHGLINTIQYFDVECNYYFDLNSISKILKRYAFKIIYADEYNRILCSPNQSQKSMKSKPISFTIDKFRAFLFKKIIDRMNFQNRSLYDLLVDGQRRDIKIRVFNKLQRLYFQNFYNSIVKTNE
ncbi:MAG: hypothetical protein AMJ78_01085 [Omnitrophica WOR_2 bacterium SM23_29]|nr:MAG: hypothetical protein AMJ78_01085 [Omnitrophica WOR_2 bacterium SM23_29]